VQRGYLSSRDILLNSIFNEANNDNAGATMLWQWVAWQIDDTSYDFSVGDDGSNAMWAQIDHMNSKVPSRSQSTHISQACWTCAPRY
jgi:hypothetical protein